MDDGVLSEFDCDLCDYVLGNVRRNLRGVGRRPVPRPDLRPGEWNALNFPEWFAYEFSGPRAALGDLVWAGVLADEAPRVQLGDAELYTLAAVFEVPPLRLDKSCLWQPDPGLHRRYVESLPQIRAGLSCRTADEWADASAAFADRLGRRPVTLSDGIEVVHEWLWVVRRYLGILGDVDRRQRPLGTGPTPLHPAPRTGPPATPHADTTSASTDTNGPAASARQRPRAGTAVQNSITIATAGEYVTPVQVAEEYPVSLSTVYAACRSGLLVHSRVPATPGAAGKYLIKRADVLGWVNSLRVGPPPPAPSASAPASSGSPAVPFSELDPTRLSRAWARRPR